MNWFNKVKTHIVWERFDELRPLPYPIYVACPQAKDESERGVVEEWSGSDVTRFVDQPHGWTHWRVKDSP